MSLGNLVYKPMPTPGSDHLKWEGGCNFTSNAKLEVVVNEITNCIMPICMPLSICIIHVTSRPSNHGYNSTDMFSTTNTL